MMAHLQATPSRPAVQAAILAAGTGRKRIGTANHATELAKPSRPGLSLSMANVVSSVVAIESPR
jgi:hypothetical protein